MKVKVTKSESIPEIQESISEITTESKIFVDRSLEIADYIFSLLEEHGLKQKDLADRMDKTEAEVSKFLSGMHNYTLRSLAKIEAALGTPIIVTPRATRRQLSFSNFHKLDYMVSEKKVVANTSRSLKYSKVVKMQKDVTKEEVIAV